MNKLLRQFSYMNLLIKISLCLILVLIPASMILLLGNTQSNQSEQTTISVYLWSDSIPIEIYQQFTAETGIKVVHSSFDSNEMLYTKMKTQGSENFNIDVIMPSTYFVDKMARENLLHELNKKKLPHFSELNPKFLDKSYDPQNTYSIPHIIGMTGIGVNASVLKEPITSWAQLWDKKYKDALLLIDDAREVFHIALVTLGYSPNTTNPDEIEQAYLKLLELAPNIKAFNVDNPAAPFLTGDINIGMLWSGSAIKAMEENDQIYMQFPQEGVIFWADNFAIPKYAKNLDGAHQFIDFLCRPEIAAQISLECGYPTPVTAAVQHLPEDIHLNDVFNPPAKEIARGIFQTDVGDMNTLYEHYYQKLKIAISTIE